MDEEKIAEIRNDLIQGNNDFLSHVFEEYEGYCINNLRRKTICPLELAEDIFVEAILNFREKVISGKLKYLTSIKNYLLTTCINMHKANTYQEMRKEVKKHEVLLYFHKGETYLFDDEEYEGLMDKSASAFKTLGEACQKILRFFYAYDYSMADIAEDMGFNSVQVAKTQKMRCYRYWLKAMDAQKKETVNEYD